MVLEVLKTQIELQCVFTRNFFFYDYFLLWVNKNSHKLIMILSCRCYYLVGCEAVLQGGAHT